jgi:hypothetical protein
VLHSKFGLRKRATSGCGCTKILMRDASCGRAPPGRRWSRCSLSREAGAWGAWQLGDSQQRAEGLESMRPLINGRPLISIAGNGSLQDWQGAAFVLFETLRLLTVLQRILHTA